MTHLYTGNFVKSFLADRVAAGFSDDLVRAEFRSFFGGDVSQKELDEFKLANAGLISEHEVKLLEKMENTGLIHRTIDLTLKLEVMAQDALSTKNVAKVTPLMSVLKSYLEMLITRQSELKGAVKEGSMKDPYALFELLKSEGAISITDEAKLRGMLAPKEVITFAKKTKKAEVTN